MSKSLQTNAPSGLARVFPIISSAKQYKRAFLRPDLIAGVTVTALIVPKNLGYAEIAGAPIENGLYAAAAGAFLYAIFGTSRQISSREFRVAPGWKADIGGQVLLAEPVAIDPDRT